MCYRNPSASNDAGPGTGTIWLEDVACAEGNEDRLSECAFTEFEPSVTCTHDNDVTVRCTGTFTDSCSVLIYGLSPPFVVIGCTWILLLACPGVVGRTSDATLPRMLLW